MEIQSALIVYSEVGKQPNRPGLFVLIGQTMAIETLLNRHRADEQHQRGPAKLRCSPKSGSFEAGDLPNSL